MTATKTATSKPVKTLSPSSVPTVESHQVKHGQWYLVRLPRQGIYHAARNYRDKLEIPRFTRFPNMTISEFPEIRGPIDPAEWVTVKPRSQAPSFKRRLQKWLKQYMTAVEMDGRVLYDSPAQVMDFVFFLQQQMTADQIVPYRSPNQTCPKPKKRK